MNWIENLSEQSQFVLFSSMKIFGVFSILMFIVAYSVWVERKVSAAIQGRIGPNRAGPFVRVLDQPPVAVPLREAAGGLRAALLPADAERRLDARLEEKSVCEDPCGGKPPASQGR